MQAIAMKTNYSSTERTITITKPLNDLLADMLHYLILLFIKLSARCTSNLYNDLYRNRRRAAAQTRNQNWNSKNFMSIMEHPSDSKVACDMFNECKGAIHLLFRQFLDAWAVSTTREPVSLAREMAEAQERFLPAYFTIVGSYLEN